MSTVKAKIKQIVPTILIKKAKSIKSNLKRSAIEKKIDSKQLQFDLKRAGFKEGDLIMVHSALSKIGNVIGGPETVIKSVLNTVGDTGTIIMPCYNKAEDVESKSQNGEYTDLREVKPVTGKITAIFRTWPGVVRSSHPFSSVCAFGANATYLIQNHDLKPYICHEDSPIMRFVELKGKVIGIGIPLAQGMGVAHILDDIWDEFPLRVHSNPFIAKYIDNCGKKIEREVYRYDPEVAKTRIDHPHGQWINTRLTEHLQKKGIMHFFNFGLAKSWYMQADFLFEELKRLAKKGVTMYLTENKLDDRNININNW